MIIAAWAPPPSRLPVNYLLPRFDVGVDVFEHRFEHGVIANTQVLDLYLAVVGPVLRYLRGVWGGQREITDTRMTHSLNPTLHNTPVTVVHHPHNQSSCKQEPIECTDGLTTLSAHSGEAVLVKCC